MSENQVHQDMAIKKQNSSTSSVIDKVEQSKHMVQCSAKAFGIHINLELDDQSINYLLKYCKKDCE